MVRATFVRVLAILTIVVIHRGSSQVVVSSPGSSPPPPPPPPPPPTGQIVVGPPGSSSPPPPNSPPPPPPPPPPPTSSPFPPSYNPKGLYLKGNPPPPVGYFAWKDCGAGLVNPFYNFKQEQNSGRGSKTFRVFNQADCNPCPAGTYKKKWGDWFCTTCPSFSFSVAGADTIAGCECFAGYGTEQNTCSACPAGKYKPHTGRTACLSCPADTYLETSGSTSSDACRQCPERRVSLAGSGAKQDCTCRAGTWEAPSRSSQSADFVTNVCECMPGYEEITPGYEGEVGGTQCSLCAANHYKPSPGPRACDYCEQNLDLFVNDEMTTCSSCQSGQYLVDEDDNTCVSCGENTAGGGFGVMSCTCANGYFGRPPDEVCVMTAADTYAERKFEAHYNSEQYSYWYETWNIQTDCPVGSTAPPGSQYLQSCRCKPGYSGLDSIVVGNPFFFQASVACTVCPRGKYKSLLGGGACLTCPVGTSTISSGSVALTDCMCMTGYTAISDGEECSACALGEYKATLGTGHCSVCPVNTSSAIGSSLLTDCKCFQEHTAASDGLACAVCWESTFKSVMGSGVCCLQNSLPGVAGGLSTECDCVAGYMGASVAGYAGTSDSPDLVIRCILCLSGGWCPGGEVRETCPSATNSPPGSMSLLDCICDEGYYGLPGGPCTACPENTYCQNSMMNACPENSVSNSGSDNITDCRCEKADFYGKDGQSCNACPENSVSDPNSTEITDCRCEKENFYGKRGQACNICPLHSVSNQSSTLVTDCRCEKAGFYGQNGQVCDLCPLDTYCEGTSNFTRCDVVASSPVGSVSVNACTCKLGAYCETPAGSSCSQGGPGCTTCERGSYWNEVDIIPNTALSVPHDALNVSNATLSWLSSPICESRVAVEGCYDRTACPVLKPITEGSGWTLPSLNLPAHCWSTPPGENFEYSSSSTADPVAQSSYSFFCTKPTDVDFSFHRLLDSNTDIFKQPVFYKIDDIPSWTTTFDKRTFTTAYPSPSQANTVGYSTYDQQDSTSGLWYTVHKFESTGVVKSTSAWAGTSFYINFARRTQVDILVVGGGGAGGYSGGSNTCGGGGSAGQVAEFTLEPIGRYFLYVGAGGQGIQTQDNFISADVNGLAGSSSRFVSTNTPFAMGGSGGGYGKSSGASTCYTGGGTSGAYGGGHGGCGLEPQTASPFPLRGRRPLTERGFEQSGTVHTGGRSLGWSPDYRRPMCGGGGGSDASGQNGWLEPGTGGSGRYSAKFQISVGGGGAGASPDVLGSASHGGGGGTSPDGQDGTGGGGGGGHYDRPFGGFGGSGLVMIRHLREPRNNPLEQWTYQDSPSSTQQGPHLLTLGMSPGGGKISHVRFGTGSSSCYFYTGADPSKAVCTRCPPGYTGSKAGSSSLAECEPICKICPAGTWRDTCKSCSPCPENTNSLADSLFMTDCKCMAGYTGISDGSPCNMCEPGTFKSFIGVGNCTDCPHPAISDMNRTGCLCSDGFKFQVPKGPAENASAYMY